MDFQGGAFLFQSGTPARVAPAPGRVVSPLDPPACGLQLPLALQLSRPSQDPRLPVLTRCCPLPLPFLLPRQVAYNAQDMHGVEAVTCGERFTLVLWFTTDLSFDEDPKLLSRLSGVFAAAWAAWHALHGVTQRFLSDAARRCESRPLASCASCDGGSRLVALHALHL